jgi:hypothetical protein
MILTLAASRRIVELDPLNPLMHAHVAWHHYMARDFSVAIINDAMAQRAWPGPRSSWQKI